MTMNGTTKMVSAIAITLIALGSILWSFAARSETLERCAVDVTTLQASVEKTQTSTHEIEKAIVLIQSDIGHMKEDVTIIKEALIIPE